MQVESKINILQNIKQATRASHDKIEENSLMKSVAHNTIDKKRYVHLLNRFYGFHKSVEANLLGSPLWQNHNFDIQARLKTSALESDLTFLGFQADFENILLCQDMPTLESNAQRLGFLYVVEGSTLGGQVLSRQLKQKFGFERGKGASYFNSYGKENLRNMWFGFQNLLTTYTEQNPQDEEQIIDTAIQTFDKLDKWLEL